jgi:hypothetical protein
MKRIALLLAALIFIQSECAAADLSYKDMNPVLARAKKSLTGWLNAIDEDMQNAAESLSGLEFKSDNARNILEGLRIGRPYVIDCSIIDAAGNMIIVQPSEYKRYEGSNVGDQAQVMMIQKTKKPVLSGAFISVENTFSVDFEYPIIGNDGEFRGAVSMLVKQHEFLGDIINKIVRGIPCKIWIMQTDGVILYSEYQQMVSKNVFSDEFFRPLKNFVDFAKKIVAEKAGSGSYEFYEHGNRYDKILPRNVIWGTAGLYDNEWRVGVVKLKNAE